MLKSFLTNFQLHNRGIICLKKILLERNRENNVIKKHLCNFEFFSQKAWDKEFICKIKEPSTPINFESANQ